MTDPINVCHNCGRGYISVNEFFCEQCEKVIQPESANDNG